ncbi:MAG: D-alanine--D-alanine ligase [Clostridia bacterium]|nr:D-alanine--D-alanine ligase [Clostridia bacterium]
MKNVLVLFGGASSEHDVSTVSAASVLKHIPEDKYQVYKMGITKEGQWYLFEGDIDLLPEDRWLDSGAITPAFVSPDRSVHGITVLRDGAYENIRVDIAFPVLHGKNGEDGTIQGLFQLAGIPFVGCDMASSAVSMDKIFTNTVADQSGVPQAAWESLTEYEYKTGVKTLDDVAEKLGYPIFVKPANAGSSVGISKAHDRKELEAAMELALQHDTRILFEEFIDGFEVECAILGNDELENGIVGQIVPANEFYDFDAKYENAASTLHIPALISEEKRAEVAESARRVFKALGCTGFSRVDFFVSRTDGRVLFNEINTIPGFTNISMYPKMMEAAGTPYAALCDRLLQLAEEKWS